MSVDESWFAARKSIHIISPDIKAIALSRAGGPLHRTLRSKRLVALKLTALVLALIGPNAVSVHATQSTPVRQVVVIFSWSRNLVDQLAVREGMIEEINRLPAEQRPKLYEEYLSADLVSDGSVATEATARMLEQKYHNIHLDAVITNQAAAARLLVDHLRKDVQHYP